MNTLHQQEAINSEEEEDTLPFQIALINYALNPIRLFFIDNPSTWQNFQYECTSNHIQHEDITIQSLCTRFINEILPCINKYNLTPHQKHTLQLLELHPKFSKSEQGYKVIDLSTKLLRESERLEGIAFTIGQPQISDNKVNEFVLKNPRDEPSPLVLQDDKGNPKCKMNSLTRETAGLLSLLVSSNGEMSNRKLLPPAAVHKRLKEAKRQYAMSGQLNDLITMPMDTMMSKFNKILQIKEKFEDLCQKSLNV